MENGKLSIRLFFIFMHTLKDSENTALIHHWPDCLGHNGPGCKTKPFILNKKTKKVPVTRPST